MSLNCGCPAAASIPSLQLQECKEGFGQIQKVLFQRVYSTAGTVNSMTTPETKATWTPLLTADDGTKVVVSPYIQAPVTEPGSPRKFGGGNQTLGGIEIIVGSDPTSFTGILYNESQKTVALMKKLCCETLGVFLVDEYGNIGCISDGKSTGAKFTPIPIYNMFVGDKKLGGFEEPDSNTVEWSFMPNWSDKLVIVKPTDFNPLTDLANS